jgi:serine protease inhibitor
MVVGSARSLRMVEKMNNIKRALVSLAIATGLLTPSTSLAATAGTGDGNTVESFGIKLFQQLAKERAKENLLISPLSISIALSMTYNGAAGTTKSTMAKVLGYGSSTEEQINLQNQTMMDSLRKPGGTTVLEIANALFGRKDMTFKQPFLNLSKKYYDAGIESLDFRDPETVTKINNWVSEKTHAKIPTILESIPADAILYLINAIYFKGLWEHQFDKAQTQPGDFHTAGGIIKSVPMMNMFRKDFRYAETPAFQAVNLPYNDKRLSLFVFLPAKDQSLAAFENEFTEENWKNWMSKFSKHEGSVQMPRFKVADSLKLKETLENAGMKIAFDQNAADFSNMADVAPQRIFISQVLHKTFMEVNEEGTEAAAVTAVEMGVTSARMDEPTPFNFVADRPYVVVLHDKQTNKILFIGHIVDPS